MTGDEFAIICWLISQFSLLIIILASSNRE